MYSKFKEELEYMRKYVGEDGFFNTLNIGGYTEDISESMLMSRNEVNYTPVHNMLETQLIAHKIRGEKQNVFN